MPKEAILSARTASLAAGLAFCLLGWVAPGASAQDYPTKPIELVVPYATGGSTDAMARIVGPRVAEHLKATVVVVNKPGASGAIGTSYMLATPDGYKVATGGNSNLGTTLAVGQKPPYSLDEVATIGRAVVNPLVIVARKGRFASFEAFVKEAREKPDTITFGSWGVKSPGHFYGELLGQTIGTKLRHIAFDGGSKAMLSALGGHVDVAVVTVSTAKTNVGAGSLSGLAVTSEKRVDDLPEVPSIRELGLPGAVYVSFDGFVTSAKVPKDRLQLLRAAFEKSLNDPQVKEELKKSGSEPAYLNGSDYEAFLKKNIETLKTVGAKAGMED